MGFIMRVAMAQINSTVGDLEGNIEKIKEYVEEAKRRKADLVVFPELPSPDILLKISYTKKTSSEKIRKR